MGQVITIMNMKGGVGKTTVAANLAGSLANYKFNERRRSVLLIDYDAQFNLSQSYIPVTDYAEVEKKRKTILSVLLEDPTKLDPFRLSVPGNECPPKVSELEYVIHKQDFTHQKLAMIPSTLDLMYVALGEPESKSKSIEERFRKFVDEARNSYDVVIIDCHPAGSIFTKTALRNSQHVIIPVIPERYSIRGIGLMLNFIEVQHQGSVGPLSHILFNKMPRIGFRPEEHTIRGNTRFGGKCLTQTLKQFKAFAEPLGGAGFVWKSVKPWSTLAFNNLMSVTTEIVQRLSL